MKQKFETKANASRDTTFLQLVENYCTIQTDN